jgi:hypothetical protein
MCPEGAVPLSESDGSLRDDKEEEDEIGGVDSKLVNTRHANYHPQEKRALDSTISRLARPS